MSILPYSIGQSKSQGKPRSKVWSPRRGQTLPLEAKSSLVTSQKGVRNCCSHLCKQLTTSLLLFCNLFILTLKKKVFECLQSATYCSSHWGTAVYKTDIILALWGAVGRGWEQPRGRQALSSDDSAVSATTKVRWESSGGWPRVKAAGQQQNAARIGEERQARLLFPVRNYQSFLLPGPIRFLLPHCTMSVLHVYFFLPCHIITCLQTEKKKKKEKLGKYSFQRKSRTVLENKKKKKK